MYAGTLNFEDKHCGRLAPVHAEQHSSSSSRRRAYALVLGINDYQPGESASEPEGTKTNRTYSPLACCLNDARVMRENLEELGFQVEVAENLTGLGIKKKVGSFVQRHKRAADADGAHGVEVRTKNTLC